MLARSAIVICVALIAATAVGAVGQPDPMSRPAIPSAGCGNSQAEAGMQFGSTTHGGVEWPWLLQVPTSHDGNTPEPLVISLHGGGESMYDGHSYFADVGETEGFVVVAPEHDRYGAWMAWYEEASIDTSPANPDVARIDVLIDDLGGKLCLDLARVYASGVSGGAVGTSVLGCALEDRIAAIAPVAWPIGPGAECTLDRPLPAVYFQGKQDPGWLWEGWASEAALDGVVASGTKWRDLPWIQADAADMKAPVPDRISGIAVRNGCEPEPASELIGSAERFTWSCPDGAEVQLIGHAGGHDWESHTSEGTTSDLIWGFFEQHPMPE